MKGIDGGHLLEDKWKCKLLSSTLVAGILRKIIHLINEDGQKNK